MMQLAQAIEAEFQAHGLTTTLDEIDTVLSLSVLSLVPSQPRWRFGGAGGASLASGLPGPGGKGTSEERDGMSKTGFYQCDYPTATACVFSEDNDQEFHNAQSPPKKVELRARGEGRVNGAPRRISDRRGQR